MKTDFGRFKGPGRVLDDCPSGVETRKRENSSDDIKRRRGVKKCGSVRELNTSRLHLKG